MIQRIQTVYLAIASILCVICLCTQIGRFTQAEETISQMYNLMYISNKGEITFDTWPLFAVLLPSTALGFYTIFKYRNRKNQMRFCQLNIMLIIGWYSLYFVFINILGASNSETIFTFNWPATLPAVAAIFYYMARHAINNDEQLIRAADRIR